MYTASTANLVFMEPIESNLAGWVTPLYKVSKYEIARSSPHGANRDNPKPSEGYYDLIDINSGKRIKLSALMKPYVEMFIKDEEGGERDESILNRSGKRPRERGKLVKSGIIQLSPCPTLSSARMSRTQRNTIVVDWNLVDVMNCVQKLRVFELQVRDWSYIPSYFYKVEDEYRLVTEAELDDSGCGRYVFQNEIGIRVLTDKAFYVEAVLADGRTSEKVKLEAAPELLLKAVVDPYGQNLSVELLGDDDDDLSDGNFCSRMNCVPVDATVCCELFGLSFLHSGLPEIRSRQFFLDDFRNEGNVNSGYRNRQDGIEQWNRNSGVREFSSGSLRLPEAINLIYMSSTGRECIKLYRCPHDWSKYRLDVNGIQIPYQATKSGFIEAKLTDGVTYASSDAIEFSPMPPPPELEITTNLRNPRYPYISMTAQSYEIWQYVACVYLHNESTIWTGKSKKVTLISDKKNTPFSNVRKFKLPTDLNLHGEDYDIVFTLPDGREWFRKSELKRFEIEVHLEGLLNFLKLFQIIRDSDLIYVRQCLLFTYRWRFYFFVIIVVLTFQAIVNFPLVGPFMCSVTDKAVSVFSDITLFFVETLYNWLIPPTFTQIGNEITIVPIEDPVISMDPVS